MIPCLDDIAFSYVYSEGLTRWLLTYSVAFQRFSSLTRLTRWLYISYARTLLYTPLKKWVYQKQNFIEETTTTRVKTYLQGQYYRLLGGSTALLIVLISTLKTPALNPPTLNPPTLNPPTLNPPTLNPLTLSPPTLILQRY